MFEYHGWISIRPNKNTTGDIADTLEAKVRKVSQLIAEHNDATSKIEVFYQNGLPFIRFDGNQEHYKAWVLELFFTIGHIAEDCDGSLFIMDEENPCLSDQYQMWVMANGSIKTTDNLAFPSTKNLQIAS